jgi:heme a synthase
VTVSTAAPSSTSTGRRLFGTVGALRAWTVASLVVNMVIVVTGAVVRLTGSGLGCPTWPRCSDTSYVPQAALGIHGVIEFANRMVTFVLIVVAVCTAVTAFRVRSTAAGAPTRPIRRLAIVVGLGIPLQGVVGGITVLTQLNPWVVSLHLLLSVVIIGLCVAMVHGAYDVSPMPVSAACRRLVVGIVVVTGVVIVLGTAVTGAGPHAGDGGVQRNGLRPDMAAQVHAAAVCLLLVLTVVTLVLTRSRLVAALLAVQLLQGVIGYVQYATGLPILGVALHMAGLALLTAVTVHVLRRLRNVAVNSNPG